LVNSGNDEAELISISSNDKEETVIAGSSNSSSEVLIANYSNDVYTVVHLHQLIHTYPTTVISCKATVGPLTKHGMVFLIGLNILWKVLTVCYPCS